MKPKEVRQLLAYHNLWRRGADIEPIEPTKLTEVLNKAVELLIQQEQSNTDVQI